MPYLRFKKDVPADSDNHHRIFLICTSGHKKGAHIGRTCASRVGDYEINPYESFYGSLTYDQYVDIKKILYDFLTRIRGINLSDKRQQKIQEREILLDFFVIGRGWSRYLF